jgi:hypothetical protein
LSQAIKKFLKSGGMIHKLPDQKTATPRVVGMKWNSSEVGGEVVN